MTNFQPTAEPRSWGEAEMASITRQRNRIQEVLEATSTVVLEASLRMIWTPGTTGSEEADGIRKELFRRRWGLVDRR